MTVADFLINVVSGGIIGSIASFVASKQFQKSNSEKNKPKLVLSNKLIEYKRSIEGCEPAIQLKLLNHTEQDLSNIKIELEGIEDLATDDSPPFLRLKLLGSREVLSIRKFDKDDKEYYHYAHHVNIFNGNDIIAQIKEFEYIRISIHATCPYFNTSTIVYNDYKVSTCLLSKNHIFNSGDVVTSRRVD